MVITYRCEIAPGWLYQPCCVMGCAWKDPSRTNAPVPMVGLPLHPLPGSSPRKEGDTPSKLALGGLGHLQGLGFIPTFQSLLQSQTNLGTLCPLPPLSCLAREQRWAEVHCAYTSRCLQALKAKAEESVQVTLASQSSHFTPPTGTQGLFPAGPG